MKADLLALFKMDDYTLSAIRGFLEVVFSSETMDGLFEKSQEKQQVVHQTLYPAY
ncbi:MAG: hypothetical protein KKF57_12835 [Firmicutes bacterium]|nr:hypothetical protein [Bacillota bacterium]